MDTLPLVLTVGLLALAGFFAGKHKARLASTQVRSHSRPHYHGYLVALWTLIPALLVVMVWSFASESVITRLVVAELPARIQQMPASEKSLFTNEFKNLANEIDVKKHIPTEAIKSSDSTAVAYQAAQRYIQLTRLSQQLKAAVTLSLAALLIWFTLHRVQPQLKARNSVETIIKGLMIVSASIAILTTVGIVFSVLFEALAFFRHVPPGEFLFGTHWSPQTAIRADQVGGSGSFGAIPLLTGTLLISAIALVVAVPLGLFSAIYLAEYASPGIRTVAKPVMEVLAGIPTVVYGFFAALTVAPFIRETAESFGISASSESALAAGLVMGIMIIPFVSSLSDDVISAVPAILRDGSYALGATKSETIRKVVIPAALPGIVGGVLLAASRAIGETMIVVMAAGLAAKLTLNPLDSVTTITTQIVTLLTGDQAFDSPKTLAAFALGLGLFVVTLTLNILSLHVVRKYREQYE